MKLHNTHRGIRGAASALAVLGLATGLAVAGASAGHAAEIPIPVALDFTELQPNTPVSKTITLEIPRAGELDSLTWVERTGILSSATIEFEVCDKTGTCVPTASLPKPVAVPAGPQSVRVTVTVSEQGSGTALGRLTLNSTADPVLDAGGGSGLASTGSIASTLAPWAVAVLALGTLAVIWPRAVIAARRRPNNEEGTK
ncbi:hypothetical protein [Microterricola pindariensis]|uniref:Uncharacterized protein n=1 Tax=Microterricola pindariensis TaxID=478010 RepID=A0ABX5AX28_9MICO|nr:hypothetical protein [Microterricola pindariensis]PPL19382.1 hypothetical protein GY24_06070 [Microterricola pindariensis]